MVTASIPSPDRGVWHLGPVPIRAYALAIIVGIVVAVWLGERRWVARGGLPGTVADIATIAVPFGLVGGRLYHVLTDPELYFGHGRRPIEALYIWRGGLGIWGAVALGGVGAWIGCRRRGAALGAFGDAIAPGIALAQAIGRFGNYFNQELFGRPTTLPWALRIDPAHRPVETPEIGLFHPTFLYESLWDVGVAGLVIWADRRFRLGAGRAFALYLAAYTAGRAWIEALRIDPANRILGLRLNEWTSVAVFLGAVAYIWLRRGSGREETVQRVPVAAATDGGPVAQS
jgi:prolipoprotein diacylglyceryl transferase